MLHHYNILHPGLKNALEFDTVYVILEAGFVKSLLPEAVLEFNSRETQVDTGPIFSSHVMLKYLIPIFVRHVAIQILMYSESINLLCMNICRLIA